MIVYVAGPYSGDVEKNIEKARQVAWSIWACGYACICPHLNTAHFDCAASYDVFMQGYLKILARCNTIIMLPDWEKSSGAVKEHQLALELAIPIAYSMKQLIHNILHWEEAVETANLYASKLTQNSLSSGA